MQHSCCMLHAQTFQPGQVPTASLQHGRYSAVAAAAAVFLLNHHVSMVGESAHCTTQMPSLHRCLQLQQQQRRPPFSDTGTDTHPAPLTRHCHPVPVPPPRWRSWRGRPRSCVSAAAACWALPASTGGVSAMQQGPHAGMDGGTHHVMCCMPFPYICLSRYGLVPRAAGLGSRRVEGLVGFPAVCFPTQSSRWCLCHMPWVQPAT